MKTSRQHSKITKHQYGVLTILSQRNSWAVKEVAEALGISSAAATKCLIRLERKGLLKRSKSTMDQRQLAARVTSSGQQLLELYSFS